MERLSNESTSKQPGRGSTVAGIQDVRRLFETIEAFTVDDTCDLVRIANTCSYVNPKSTHTP
jgi:hypothetical protein